jgi:excisionase family DNA binding protein
MAQGYYTLEEAAQILGMTADNLKHVARKGEIRSFQDRGTWRFRVQDIQEMARQRGLGSDVDLVLGEALKPKAGDSPTRRPKVDSDVLSVLGQEPPGSDEVILVDLPSPTPSPTSKPASGRNLQKTPPPAVKDPSDSDVRLTAEGSSIDFAVDDADEAKMVDTPTPPRSSKPASGKTSKIVLQGPKSPSGAHTGGITSEPAPPSSRRIVRDSDSDVKLVDASPSPSDSNVNIAGGASKASTDSDIRLEAPKGPAPRADEGLLTDEIDLDADLRKEAQASKPQSKSRVSQGKQQLKQKTPPPSKSPFELTESGMAPRQPGKPPSDDAIPTLPDSSSDFELTPVGDSQSPLELGSSDEFELALPNDAVELGQEPIGLKDKDSGINLNNPADKGISLEGPTSDSDSIEFELSLDSHEPTPKPAPAEPEIASDSEFELTLDDSGGLAPLESDAGSPTEKAAAEKDIFETDFEVPALEDDSGSEALALDETSSDFDLALEPDDISIDDESGSQVVAVDESAVDEGAATVARPSKGARGRGAVVAEDDDLGGLFGEVGEEEPGAELEPAAAGGYREVAVEAAPAPWGVLPVAVLLPCIIVLFIVGMMGFELVQNTNGYRPPGFFTKAIGEPVANMLGVPFRKT